MRSHAAILALAIASGGILVGLVPAAYAAGGNDAIRHVQEVLREKGLYSGPVDGSSGPMTRRAIRAFQRQAGLPESGTLDEMTLRPLDQAASAPPPVPSPVPGKVALPSPAPDTGALPPTKPQKAEAVVAKPPLAAGPAVGSKADAPSGVPGSQGAPVVAPEKSPQAVNVSGALLLFIGAFLWWRRRQRGKTPATSGMVHEPTMVQAAPEEAPVSTRSALRESHKPPITMTGHGVAMCPSLPSGPDPSTCGRTSSCRNLGTTLCPLLKGRIGYNCVNFRDLGAEVTLDELQAENDKGTLAGVDPRPPQTAAPGPGLARVTHFTSAGGLENRRISAQSVHEEPPVSTRDVRPVPSATAGEPLARVVIPVAPRATGSTPAVSPAASAPSPTGPLPGGTVDWSNLGFHRPVAASPLSRPSASEDKTAGGWLPKGRTVTMGGVTITGGLIYVGASLPRLSGGCADERSLIRPNLPVRDPGPHGIVPRLPYYPAYDALDPAQRWAYLTWLANGRRDASADIGMVFLYFYGLERRLIGERAEADRADIVAEVERLRGIYGSNPSFARYSGALLAAARTMAGTLPVQPPPMPERGLELPPDLRVDLGRVIAATARLSGEWLWVWLVSDQGVPSQTLAQRAGREFRTLFLRRFDRDFPKGMAVTVPKRLFSPRYRAASGSFEVPVLAESEGVPDVTALRAPLEKGNEIANRCRDDLDALSRFLGKFPDRRDSLDAYLLLPDDLRDAETPAVTEFRAWIAGTVVEPAALVPLAEVLRRLGQVVPEKLVRRDIQTVAGKLAAFGVGLEPDPAFGARLPRLDEAVALFPLGNSPPAAPSDGWSSGVLTLALAVTIAHADGLVVSQERELLHAHVETADVSDGERPRLAAHLHLLLAHPPDLGALRARSAGLPLETRRQIGRLAIAVAAADGVIHPAEVKLLSKLYRALGLDPDSIYGELHAFGTGATDTRAPVRAAPSGVSPVIQLDIDRIHRIRADTARVSAVLSTVFVEETIPEPEPVAVLDPDPADEEANPDLFPGLDISHRALLRELAVAEHWPRADYERLARSLDLMPEGALEVINDWSFERFDEPVLEDDDPINVNLALLSSPQTGPSPHA